MDLGERVEYDQSPKRNMDCSYLVPSSDLDGKNQDNDSSNQKAIVEIAQPWNWYTSIEASKQYKDYEPAQNTLRRFKHDGGPSNSRSSACCPFPFRQPTVFWDGTVVGSEHDYELELPLGKIGEQPFSEMWNGPNAIRLRRSMRQGRNLPKFCEACPHSDSIRDGVEIIHKELRSPH